MKRDNEKQSIYLQMQSYRLQNATEYDIIQLIKGSMKKRGLFYTKVTLLG